MSERECCMSVDPSQPGDLAEGQAASLGLGQIRRYDLRTNYRCGSSIEEMEQDDDGDWVRYEDIAALLASERTARQQAEQAWRVLGFGRWEQVGDIGGWISYGFSDPPGNLGLAAPTHWQELPLLPGAERDALRSALHLQQQTDQDDTRSHQPAACSACGGPRPVVNGDWLRERRKAAGLTLREMAGRLDFSAPYISDVERNRRNCTPAIRKAYEAL